MSADSHRGKCLLLTLLIRQWFMVTSVPLQVQAGRFLLDGVEVSLPVKESDSLALKVEALRMFLEEALGTTAFLK